MDFDPNATPEERKRSGPRWYSVVAFLVIAFLLLLNAVAIFGNAEANSEQACYTRALAWAELLGNEGHEWAKFTEEGLRTLTGKVVDCEVEHLRLEFD